MATREGAESLAAGSFTSVGTTTDPAFATRNGGRIVSWNSSAEKLLGYREAEILGTTCYQTLRGRDVFGNSYCCCLNCPDRSMVQRCEAVHPFEICFRSAAGKYIPVVATVIVTPEEEPSRPDVIHLLYPQNEGVLESEPPLDPEPADDAFSYYARLRRVETFVETHYADPVSLSLAAEVAAMEPRYFSKFFHDKTGMCFKDWLAKMRVARAKEMMASSNHTITQIAFSVGFGDLRTFERNFKKHVGITPREFKETVRPLKAEQDRD